MSSYSCSRTYYLRCLQENADHIEVQSISENAQNGDVESERQLDPNSSQDSDEDREFRFHERLSDERRPFGKNPKRTGADGEAQSYSQILRDFADQMGDQPGSNILRDVADKKEHRSEISP
ncbi:hypothetical protein EQM14_04595 [Caproiciproducens sp. NJN-50]|uniref:hypothetical protein n=1 Tax=Acutalibacteraceae TaxID=3082771 RepID=UPI000FFE12B9|nr:MULTISPECIES: hypothetical protein [Acutalibacteraceae]QAT49110.1 hypothetical protein EQM14_04595 [Caproiciproducens sp. NJN-50]